ncbi:MAG: pyridoxamine 5'-phosphate oxidase family protein [Actinobacteria bacterium]|nr:pyridoxamine 5'-phosphate oxidase family protein [Actinomycetota bacterium]
MGKIYEKIDEALAAWMDAQHVFFVGTAPLAGHGHVNVSPKGGRGSFQVLGPDRVGYLDIAGSGAETIAHIRENGRIVIMFAAFEGRPRIVRLHGRGIVHQAGDQRFGELLPQFEGAELHPAARRSIIEVEVDRVADSCGYSVPLMSYEGTRPNQDLWTEKRLDKHGPDGVRDYVREKNQESLDGLPAIDPTLL